MERYDPQTGADPAEMAREASGHLTGAPEEHTHTAPSVREVTYNGHVIRIETTYSITVDGKPVGGHVMVNNAGKVHYHSIPNQEFTSAVDMVKRIVDLTPAEAYLSPEEASEPDAGGHQHDHHG